MSDINPREFDEALAQLHDKAAQADRLVTVTIDRLHWMAGDKKEHVGRRSRWRRPDGEVRSGIEHAAAHGDAYNASVSARPSEVLTALRQAKDASLHLRGRIVQADEIYEQHRWSRLFPCKNADGHIHASLRGCSTVRWDTDMAWAPALSGKTVEEAVAELGPTLCSVCFPAAPVEWRMKKSDSERAARDAEKAAREESVYAKRLRDNEIFRDHHGDRVLTVAACKQILRDEVWLRNPYGRGPSHHHFDARAVAEQATGVLLAREARQPGTGATQEQIDKIIASAVKRNRANGARI